MMVIGTVLLYLYSCYWKSSAFFQCRLLAKLPGIGTVPLYLSLIAGYWNCSSLFVCRSLEQSFFICMPVIGTVTLYLYDGYWNCFPLSLYAGYWNSSSFFVCRLLE